MTHETQQSSSISFMDRIGSEFMHDACKESEKLKLAFSHEETAYTPADSILGDY